MGTNIDYNHMLEQVLDKNKIISEPSDLVEQWNEFVQQCVEGYQYSLFEFDYEVSVRDEIQQIIDDGRLQEYEEFKDFVNKVDEIDNNFKSVVNDFKIPERDKLPWWKKGILKKAGDQYVQNVKDELGLEVQRL